MSFLLTIPKNDKCIITAVVPAAFVLPPLEVVPW